jgi:hypothetical protein
VPIVLHTLPATANPPDTTPTPALADGTGRVNPKPNANPPSLAHTASTVPRLISVVEIIKREYLKKLELEHSSTLLGLHQYNEIGTLEEELRAPDPPHDTAHADAARSQAIVAALRGTTQYVSVFPFESRAGRSHIWFEA